MKLLNNLRDYQIIKNSGLFDKTYYFESYPEAKASGINPIFHYVKYGWKEGKNPSRNFDTKFYLNEYEDVRISGINPLVHYLRWGKKEGRAPEELPYKTYFMYDQWIEKNEKSNTEKNFYVNSQIFSFSILPKFTILILIDKVSNSSLHNSIKSLCNQVYENWEAVLIIPQQEISQINNKIKKIVRTDKRLFIETINDVFSIDAILLKHQCDYFCVLQQNDTLSTFAFYALTHAINHNPDVSIIYADEDIIDEHGNRNDPFFKPDWNPDLFRSHNYLGNFTVFKKGNFRGLSSFKIINLEEFQWQIYFQLISHTNPEQILHLPYVLYHKQQNYLEFKNSLVNNHKIDEIKDRHPLDQYDLKENITSIQKEAVGFHIKYRIPEPKPLVSILIPTKNGYQHLSSCVESILSKTLYENFEIIIINNQSTDKDTLDYLSSIRKHRNISIVEFDFPFNYSRINNFAVESANGEIVILLNDDTEVITKQWIDELVGHAIRPEIGAVGCMLYYPDDTIQHAGVILGIGGVAAHAYKGKPKGYLGQRGRAQLTQNYSAVTGACLAIEKSKFESVGGFKEHQLPIAFNDVDLCLRLIKAGYRNLWTPFAELYHHESKTRGVDIASEDLLRAQEEVQYMKDEWGAFLLNDPAYNPNLSLEHLDFSLAHPPRVTLPWKPD